MAKEILKLVLLLIVFLTLFSITGQLNKKNSTSQESNDKTQEPRIVQRGNSSTQDLYSSDSLAIHRCIVTLFEGMAEGDSAKVRSSFHKDARMTSTFRSKGEIKLREGSLVEFLEAIGSPHDKVWNERLLGFELIQNDLLAQVWTPYEFYLDDTFSHCGVNAFQMIKTEKSGWRILYLTDTRMKEGCLEVD